MGFAALSPSYGPLPWTGRHLNRAKSAQRWRVIHRILNPVAAVAVLNFDIPSLAVFRGDIWVVWIRTPELPCSCWISYPWNRIVTLFSPVLQKPWNIVHDCLFGAPPDIARR